MHRSQLHDMHGTMSQHPPDPPWVDPVKCAWDELNTETSETNVRLNFPYVGVQSPIPCPLDLQKLCFYNGMSAQKRFSIFYHHHKHYFFKLNWIQISFVLKMVPDLLCSSPPCLLIPAMLLDPPEEWGEWLKLLEFEGDAGLLANVGNLTGLVPLLTVVWKTKWKIICSFLIEINKIAAEVCSLFSSSSETSTEEQRGYQKESYFTYTYRQNIYLYKYIYTEYIY